MHKKNIPGIVHVHEENIHGLVLVHVHVHNTCHCIYILFYMYV